ncbi:hypothetical protein NT05LI_3803, partial [Listeria ivanovii FSL F6-596]
MAFNGCFSINRYSLASKFLELSTTNGCICHGHTVIS